MRAFVVEDHAFQRGGLVAMLRTLGVREVAEAANGLDALAQLEAAMPALPPDVILCDLEMPEMDGIEFLRAVAERRLARCVIIVSGRETEILRSGAAMARASGLAVLGCLEKPPTLAALRRLLSGGLPHVSTLPSAMPMPLDAAALQQALEAREFQCEYQPKVALRDRALVGVEALVRWHRPGQAALAPGLFVPAMVDAGLVAPLTDQVLEATCLALNAWAAEGRTLDAAVNISVSMMSDVRSADHLLAQVRRHGIEPRRITFEITETEVMADVAAVLNVMSRLRLKGFCLAIDDFGTGYSSLAQLNTIPVTELKIDQTFVRHCERSKRLRHIIRSCIELAQRLGIRSVAEGVESREEWELLRRAGCWAGQGYYVARPMPAERIAAWAEHWRRAGAEAGP